MVELDCSRLNGQRDILSMLMLLLLLLLRCKTIWLSDGFRHWHGTALTLQSGPEQSSLLLLKNYFPFRRRAESWITRCTSVSVALNFHHYSVSVCTVELVVVVVYISKCACHEVDRKRSVEWAVQFWLVYTIKSCFSYWILKIFWLKICRRKSGKGTSYWPPIVLVASQLRWRQLWRCWCPAKMNHEMCGGGALNV